MGQEACHVRLAWVVRVEVKPVEGVSAQKVQEPKIALRELGLRIRLRARNDLIQPVEIQSRRHDRSSESEDLGRLQ